MYVPPYVEAVMTRRHQHVTVNATVVGPIPTRGNGNINNLIPERGNENIKYLIFTSGN